MVKRLKVPAGLHGLARRRWRYANDGGKRRRYNSRWKGEHRVSVNTWNRDYARRVASDPEGYRRLWLNNIKLRAKKKGLPFDLTLDDLPVPEFCPVLGIPLQPRSGKFHDRSPSIDRLVPERGYVKGNVAVISYRANRIKDYGTLEELKKVVAYLERHLP